MKQKSYATPYCLCYTDSSMKKGGRVLVGSGFTIVETLIVLAVSSILFVIAGTMITGRQARTEFQVGSRDIQTKVQQIINETKSGYFGTDSTSDCATSGTSTPPGLIFSTSDKSLGSRGQCIFIGKALVVDTTGVSIYPLAGLRQVAGADVSSAKEARATVVRGSSETYEFPYGMTLVGSAVNSDSLDAGTPRGFAILTSFGTTKALGGQTFDLHKMNGSFTDASQYADVIDSEFTQADSVAFQTVSGVTLCIKSGGTNQSFKVIIGGDNGTTVRTEVKGNTSCAD